MTKFWRRKSHRRKRDRYFDFIELPRRRERWFKRAICCITLLAIAVPLVVLPRGRYLVVEAASRVRKAGRLAILQQTPRAEIEDDWQRFRLRNIALSRQRLTEIYQSTEPAYQNLMRYAGLDPDHGLLRWGNFDQTLLLPSTVFEPDQEGRSYRMRRCTRSIWLREVTIESGALAFFLIPDRPELRDAIKGTTAIPVEESRQLTNSWGLRGPEPECDAPLRGIVLGDSFMQGLFVGEDHTPPECLRRELESRLKTRVSILNAGVLGYSPEQYYYSLLAFADRFKPQFLVVSLFANDFGDANRIWAGGGDWREGKHWLDLIASFAQTRGWTCLFVPVPEGAHVLGNRKSGFYPGEISNVLGTSAVTFLNPSEAFVNAHLDTLTRAEQRGERPSGCLLYNDKIHDGHFSALGAQVWGEAVGRRLALLIELRNKG